MAVALGIAVLAGGCGNNSGIELSADKTNVVASFYPLYDFASKIGGERIHAVSAVPAGVEPHDWEPKTRDISQILKADLFVYQGAGLEGWVDDLLKSRKDKNSLITVEASAGLELIKAEDHEEEEGHEEEGHEDEEGHDHGDFDPHAWLSPMNAKKMAEAVKNGLAEADPANKTEYEANFAKLSASFDELDRKYRDTLSKLTKKDIVVSHKAFAYLCRDYGLNQVAIMGLTPDSEPTAQDMKKINDFIKEHQVKYIFFEELVSDKLAKTLANDLKIETLVLNPLEGLTDAQLKAGEDYFSIMEKNLQNLVKALQ
ncbi:ABC transporter substrate-binding protein [Paenibacillus sp. YN15]|nr:ABC transporter substrate-binding protein [Paenibacillus sp. YN15]